MKTLYIIVALITLPLMAMGQKERSDIRNGNKNFGGGNYSAAEVDYKRAMTKNEASLPALFNLGGSIYKQSSRMAEAEKVYESLSKNPAIEQDVELRSSTSYNLGNSQLKQRKIDEAIESYKNALRLNPNDKEAKFNLAYAQKLKEGQQKDKDQNKDKDQKDKDKKQDQKDQKDNKDQQKQDKDKDKDKEQEQQAQPQNQDTQRMLNALQAAEDKTKRQMDEQKEKQKAVVGVGGKNW